MPAANEAVRRDEFQHIVYSRSPYGAAPPAAIHTAHESLDRGETVVQDGGRRIGGTTSERVPSERRRLRTPRGALVRGEHAVREAPPGQSVASSPRGPLVLGLGERPVPALPFPPYP